MAALVTGVSAALAATLYCGLPALAVIDHGMEGGEAGPWALAGPLFAGAGCLLWLSWKLRRIRRGQLAWEHVAGLPGQMSLLFLLAALLSILIGPTIWPRAGLAARPAVLLVGAPALVLAHALILRLLVQAPLMAEMARQLGSSRITRPNGPAARVPLLSLRRGMAAAALAASAAGLGLIAAHADSRARREREVLAEAHLRDLLEVAALQLIRIPEESLPAFLNGYPANPSGWPLLADLQGRVLLPAGAARGDARLVVKGNHCRWSPRGKRTYHCAARRVHDRQLIILGPSALSAGYGPTEELPLGLILFCAGLLGVAGLLGWAVGRDTSQDFRVMAHQLEAMAREDDPNLGRPIPVTSIDEVGDLTAAIGSLRQHLHSEIEGYRESLRKTEEADRLRKRFFSDVSHALRTPLTTVYGSSQLLAEGLVGELPEAQKHDVEIIQSSAGHLLALINEIIDVSVIESGHVSLHLEKVDAVQICQELLLASEGLARRRQQETGKKLELQLACEPELPLILADPVRLRQIVQNLVANAITYTDEGHIKLSVARRDERKLIITVEDTGRGISAADLAHIFERYWRAQPSGGSHRPGTGLGLGITKQLVELHGGEISVRSEIAQGSTFSVVLPLQGPASGGRSGADSGETA